MKKIIIVLVLLLLVAGCLAFYYFYPEAEPIFKTIPPLVVGVFGFFAGTWVSNLKASMEIFEELNGNKDLDGIRDDQLALHRKFKGFPPLAPGRYRTTPQTQAELHFDNDLDRFCRKTLERLEMPLFLTLPFAFATDPWKNSLLELMRDSSRFRDVTRRVIEKKTATSRYCRLLNKLLTQVEKEKKS